MRETRVRSTRIHPSSGTGGLINNKKSNSPPTLKSRKWKRALVRLGSIIVPRWVPETPTPTQSLQQYNTGKDKKLSNKKARKRLSTTEQKAEVVGSVLH